MEAELIAKKPRKTPGYSATKKKTASPRRHSPGKPGGQLSRTEVITIRLDRRLRYLAELAARKQRRTLSSLIEWAIDQSLKQVEFGEKSTIADGAAALWDVNPCDRLVKLAMLDENLLTFEEQFIWKVIGHLKDPGIVAKDINKVNWDRVRAGWVEGGFVDQVVMKRNGARL